MQYKNSYCSKPENSDLSDLQTHMREKRAWGGARNRADRVSAALSQHQAEGLLKAMAVAELRGWPLNRHWTVDYELAGIADKEGAAFVGHLLALCRRYARARGVPFAAVWVREVGKRNGAHVHIAMHFPAGMRLGHLNRKWIGQAGGKYQQGNSKVRSIGGSLKSGDGGGAHYWANLEALGNYLTKGSAPEVVEELGLNLTKSGGEIIGKRCGWTQNLRNG